MRCGCPECGVLTVHIERGMDSHCRCPQCGWVCRACLGREQGSERPVSREEALLMRRVHDEMEKKA